MSETSEEAKRDEELQAAYESITSRLDAGVRQFLMGFLLSTGDSLASSPNKTSIHCLFILHAYVISHGTTDSGQAGLTDKDTFEAAKELINDLSLYLRAMDEISKAKTPEEWRHFVQQPLRRLEKKYSQKSKVTIYNDPTLLEQKIIDAVFEIYPTVISHITNLIALNSRGGFQMFNTGNILRFHGPWDKPGSSP